MDDNTSLREKFRSKMSVLQEALDNSPYAEKKGICIPIDDVLTAILAIYYYLNRDEVEKTPDPEKKDEVDVKPEQTPNPDTGSDDGGSGTGEVDDSASSDITPYLPIDTDWSKVDWKKRMLGDSDIKNGNGKGYNPSTCRFWEPKSKENDPYGFWDIYTGDNNFTEIVKMVADLFDYGTVSFKEFNRVHFHKTDRNFTIGFQHLANDNVVEFFNDYILSKERIYNELCHYFVYRLNDKNDNMAQSYRLQAADDEILKPILFPDKDTKAKITTEMADAISLDKWEKAIRYFFSTDGLLPNGKQYPKKVSSLTGKKRLRFALWAEDQMIKYYGENNFRTVKTEEDPNYVYPFPQIHYDTYNGYPACDLVELFQRFIEVEIDKDKGKGKGKSKSKSKKIYDNPMTYKSGFWFHDILKDALTLKTVAAEQIRFWWKHFYVGKIKPTYEKDLGINYVFTDKNNKTIYRDIKTDKTLRAAICIYSSIKNNAFSIDGHSNRADSEQWVIYQGETYTIEESKYSSDSGNIEEDRTMAMIFLLGMTYETQSPGRSRMDYMLDNFWREMWYLNGEKLGKNVPILAQCSLISRKKG